MNVDHRESSTFLIAFAALPLALGLAIGIYGLTVSSHYHNWWEDFWLDGGIALVVITAVMAGRAVFLRRARNGTEGPPLSPLEEWLQGRIVAANGISRQRASRGDAWHFGAMSDWDVTNCTELALGDEPVAPELLDNYRRNVLTALVDGIGPPHDTPEQDRYYNARLAWCRRAFRASRDGTSIATPLEPAVSEAHRHELHSIAAGLVDHSMALERQASYHPRGQNGTQLLAQSFRTHFPQVARMLDGWDQLVAARLTAHRALRDWMEATWQDRASPFPPTFVYSELAEHGGDTLPWGQNDWLTLAGGVGIAQITEGLDVDEVKRPYDEFLDEVLATDEARELEQLRYRVDAAK